MVLIEEGVKLDFKDVLIRPKRSTLRSRAQVNLDRTYTFKHSKREWTGVPIMAANMDTVGTFTMAEELSRHNLLTCVHKHYSIKEWEDWGAKYPDVLKSVAVSMGTSDEDFQKVSQISDKLDVPFICMDVANGYSEHFVQAVRKTRERFDRATIVAGNVVTGEMVEELILSGADVVKVGIGPGSVCTTRKQTGVGYPQLSAIMECADAAHGLNGLVVGDGGCTCPGDLSKAFGAGADFVMLGGMLAGHDEAAGEVIEVNGNHYKHFYGMSSGTAMNKHAGGVAEYPSSDGKTVILVPYRGLCGSLLTTYLPTRHAGGVAEYRSSEGKTVMVPYRGPVAATIQDILGGVRSTCTYVGASKLKELSKRTTFIRVTQQLNQVFGEDQRPQPVPQSPRK